MVLPLRRDARGQSAAIGTILAILVLLTILTVVTTRWIPVWVEGREAEHASTVDAQFADLKRTIDQQALVGIPGQGVGNPITLGQPGVPIFAPGSRGTLNVGAYGAGLFRNHMELRNDTGLFNATSFGSLKYTTLNTRYIQQEHLYEFGGVIVNQSDGQVLKVGPSVTVENNSGLVELRITMLSINGDGNSITSDSTVGVRTTLQFAPAVSDFNFTTPQTFHLNITSEAASAWATFLNKTISSRLSAGQFNIALDLDAMRASLTLFNVNRLVVSYQIYQADLDVA